MDIEEMKIQALAKHLDLEETEIELIEEEWYQDNQFNYDGSQEYLVLTYEEMELEAKERILDSIWAFRSDFLIYYLKGELTTKHIERIQKDLCEDANEVFKALLDDEDRFVSDAISTDGYGHFLSHYDGEEHEETIEKETFHIFRQN
jgi:hypothetical protein